MSRFNYWNDQVDIYRRLNLSMTKSVETSSLEDDVLMFLSSTFDRNILPYPLFSLRGSTAESLFSVTVIITQLHDTSVRCRQTTPIFFLLISVKFDLSVLEVWDCICKGTFYFLSWSYVCSRLSQSINVGNFTRYGDVVYLKNVIKSISLRSV